MDSNTKNVASAEEVVALDELNAMDAVADGYRASLGRRVLFWCMRWLIGFGIIAAVVANKPEWSWLWWVGVGVAGVSLLVLVVSNFVLQRKISTAKEGVKDAMQEAQAMMAEDTHP